MGDPTQPTPAALTHAARAYAAREGINGGVDRWPGKVWWFAWAEVGGAMVSVCAHTHRDERAARKCAAKLVLAEAREDMQRGQLFS